MLVQETIQPLYRFYNANINANTDTDVISISNAQAVRIVVHVGAISGSGSASLQVLVNLTNNTSGAQQVANKTVTLNQNSVYEIFVTGAEAYTARPRATHLFVRFIVDSVSFPAAIEISALPGRDIPASLPANWTRVL